MIDQIQFGAYKRVRAAHVQGLQGSFSPFSPFPPFRAVQHSTRGFGYLVLSVYLHVPCWLQIVGHRHTMPTGT